MIMLTIIIIIIIIIVMHQDGGPDHLAGLREEGVPGHHLRPGLYYTILYYCTMI